MFSGLDPFTTFAQTSKAVEADLLKSLKKLNYWGWHKDDGKLDGEDSLAKANDKFGRQLSLYASKYSFTIDQPFGLLKKEHLLISTSSDGLFRIYSWDTQEGGTMHFFSNVFQYKSNGLTKSLLDTPKSAGDIGAYYDKIYTFNDGGKHYYLCVYMFIESSRYQGAGIKVFLIENGKLNDKVKLIKTNSGIQEQLSYEYDFGSIIDWKVRPEIYFDEPSKTINLPLIASNGKVTHHYVTYKFTGQYFERIKN